METHLWAKNILDQISIRTFRFQILWPRPFEYSRNPHKRTYIYKNLEAEMSSFEPSKWKPQRGWDWDWFLHNGFHIVQFKNSRVEIFIGCLCSDWSLQILQIIKESLKVFHNVLLTQHFTKFLNKNSSQKTFSKSVKNSCAETA